MHVPQKSSLLASSWSCRHPVRRHSISSNRTTLVIVIVIVIHTSAVVEKVAVGFDYGGANLVPLVLFFDAVDDVCS